jgi:hypothetical protein
MPTRESVIARYIREAAFVLESHLAAGLPFQDILDPNNYEANANAAAAAAGAASPKRRRRKSSPADQPARRRRRKNSDDEENDDEEEEEEQKKEERESSAAAASKANGNAHPHPSSAKRPATEVGKDWAKGTRWCETCCKRHRPEVACIVPESPASDSDDAAVSSPPRRKRAPTKKKQVKKTQLVQEEDEEEEGQQQEEKQSATLLPEHNANGGEPDSGGETDDSVDVPMNGASLPRDGRRKHDTGLLSVALTAIPKRWGGATTSTLLEILKATRTAGAAAAATADSPDSPESPAKVGGPLQAPMIDISGVDLTANIFGTELVRQTYRAVASKVCCWGGVVGRWG